MFTIQESKEIEPWLRRAYSSDQALLEQWHVVAGSGLDACVKDTLSVLTTDTFPDFKFYVVEEGGSFAGYFGVEADGKYLTTIFIDPKKRGKKYDFWGAILPYLSPEFCAAIYIKNRPCVRFYKKMGKFVNRFELRGHHLALFRFDRSPKCH